MLHALSLLIGTICLGFVQAHYAFPQLLVNGTLSSEWQYIRMTENRWHSGPVEDLSSSAIRCYELDSDSAGNAAIATVAAGTTVGFRANNLMGHPGYFSAYMTPASPAANSNEAGLGDTWFKIWEWSPGYTPETGLIFDSANIWEFTFEIPKNLPSGQYLLRGEQIALHVAFNLNGAQVYLGCAQLNVINGGSGTPGPTVSFPGAYSATDPGIFLNIYALPGGYTGYQPPGPPVWQG